MSVSVLEIDPMLFVMPPALSEFIDLLQASRSVSGSPFKAPVAPYDILW